MLERGICIRITTTRGIYIYTKNIEVIIIKRGHAIRTGIIHYLVNTLITSIDQSISKCKPSLCISAIYLKKH
jgi:hypothetical protein